MLTLLTLWETSNRSIIKQQQKLAAPPWNRHKEQSDNEKTLVLLEPCSSLSFNSLSTLRANWYNCRWFLLVSFSETGLAQLIAVLLRLGWTSIWNKIRMQCVWMKPYAAYLASRPEFSCSFWEFTICIIFFLVLVYVHFHLRLRNEVWSASVSHSVSFTMWILMLRKQRKTKLFSPMLQIWNPEFFSILQEIFPWTRSSLHLTHYWISQSPRLVVKPQMYHLLSYLVNFRQLWYKSYWHWQFSMDWCVTICLMIPVGTSVDQKAVLCSVQ